LLPLLSRSRLELSQLGVHLLLSLLLPWLLWLSRCTNLLALDELLQLLLQLYLLIIINLEVILADGLDPLHKLASESPTRFVENE
jgi:hypothetical protein